MLPEPVVIDTVKYTEDNKAYRLAKFKKEFSEHFDLEYCLIYFILTELLVLYDSRGKNMMLASWGPQVQGGNYIWYPIFYDVDTQLGINNSGVPLWDYDISPSDRKVFSTPDSVLWNNFYDAFLINIREKYASLRKTKLNYRNLNGYYDYDPNISQSYAMRGVRPYVVYNADEYFKYIAPARTGYIDTEGNVQFTSTYYYCAQGTRELQRELFLTNRFYFMDSKFQGGSFDSANKGGVIQMRVNYNVEDGTSDDLVGNIDTYPTEYDVPPYFALTPYLKSYPGIYIDESTFVGGNQLASPGEEKEIYVEELEVKYRDTHLSENKGQLIYLCGKDYLSDVGDLSRYYLDELDISKTPRLTKLYVGSDLEGYENKYFTEGKFAFDNNYPLLEDINFTKLAYWVNELDFSNSTKLKIFRALGSGVPGVKFADGVQLDTCYLPKCIKNLRFIEANSLTNLLEIKPNYNYENESWPQGLYVEGLTNYLDEDKIAEASNDDLVTNITSFYMVGGKLGVQSYKLLKALTLIKQKIHLSTDPNVSKDLSIHMTDVQWSPYQRIESGDSYNQSITYYRLTDHYTFESYIPSSNAQWNKDTLNGKIYKRTFAIDNNYPITDLSLLDTFIENVDDYFHDSSSNSNTRPYLSGSIYINNSTPIDEAIIKNYYNMYYPNLNIYVKNVTPALTINYVEIKDNGQEFVWETQKFAQDIENDKIPQISITPTKANWDFQGWTLDPNSGVIDNKQPSDYTIEEIRAKMEELGLTDNVLTFYAIYNIHSYVFTFFNSDGSGLIYDDDGILQPYVLTIPYGDQLYAPRDIIPYLDDSGLGLEQTYNFVGYSLQSQNQGDSVDFTKLTSIKDQTFYALFELMDVHKEEACHYDWFNYTLGTYRRNSYMNDETEFSGYYISPKFSLKGKITLPSTYNGKPIIGVGSNAFLQGDGEKFKHEITHIFIQKNSQLKILSSNCFRNLTTLEWFDFGTKDYGDLEVIEIDAFRGVPLKNRTLGQKLSYVATGAFINAFSDDANKTLYIPASIKTVGERGFSFLRLGVGSEIIIGSQEEPSQLDLSLPSINAIEKFATDQNINMSGAPYRVQKVEFYSAIYNGPEEPIGESNKTVANAFTNIKDIHVERR